LKTKITQKPNVDVLLSRALQAVGDVEACLGLINISCVDDLEKKVATLCSLQSKTDKNINAHHNQPTEEILRIS
jgi:hypothetical protein